jgi:flagellar assembly protein FliH
MKKFIKAFKEIKIQFLKKVEEEAEKLKLKSIQEGEKKGYSEGLEKGKAEIIEKFEENVNIIKRAHDDVNNRMQEIIKNSEKDVLRLSIAIAEKIIREKIEGNDEIVLNSLKFILKTVPQVNKVVIYFNPAEFERIKNSSSEFIEIMERYKEIKFVDDARIEKGGVIVETELGNINGQPGSQIEKLKRVFDTISS